eukprot:2106588-Rhodomonas_salina.2
MLAACALVPYLPMRCPVLNQRICSQTSRSRTSMSGPAETLKYAIPSAYALARRCPAKISYFSPTAHTNAYATSASAMKCIVSPHCATRLRMQAQQLLCMCNAMSGTDATYAAPRCVSLDAAGCPQEPAHVLASPAIELHLCSALLLT